MRWREEERRSEERLGRGVFREGDANRRGHSAVGKVRWEGGGLWDAKWETLGFCPGSDGWKKADGPGMDDDAGTRESWGSGMMISGDGDAHLLRPRIGLWGGRSSTFLAFKGLGLVD